MNKLKHLLARLKNYRPADRPHKRKRAWTPKGYGAKRLGMLMIWTWVGIVTLVIVATLTAPKAADVEQVQSIEVNPATGTAAAEFAKQFADQYFKWETGTEGVAERQERLAPLLAEGLDDNAGLIVAGQTWNSATGSKQVLAVEETGPNKAVITLQVEQVLNREVEDEKESERIFHQFAVPVAFQDAYGVYALPNFSAVTTETALKMESLQGAAVDGVTANNIKNFLATFFQSYTTGTPDQLAYFLEDETAKGLEGSKTFVEVQTVNVVEVGNQYLVEAGILLQDPISEINYLTNYRMAVETEEDKFKVTKLNKGDE